MGLIPFVRSNVMQSCKTGETNNNMFGYAKNPWNEERSCGGSSGGEGGLIGSYCSPIGFGTDIGGSIRIPAEWNGLTALKPALRYSRKGNCYYGRMTDGSPIKSELGPISRST
jgi:Asp-tRNA(Asn)/Glu-tRNA(Gln) amidotransferase A subunit family amidase